jgi:glycosyltransferase involved in cell wall biosynthesis
MKILMVHDYYRNRGGEDVSFESEHELLKSYGNGVLVFTKNNNDINNRNIRDDVQFALNTIWSDTAYDELSKTILQFKPDIVHFQNIFPLFSPSVYYVCENAGIPVVQTLRNYRLICPNAEFYRDGHPCEDCIDRPFPWPGIMHACYHHSHHETAAVALMIAYHHWRKTWEKKVEIYIALTDFSRRKFIGRVAGADKIIVKPNFVQDPGKSDQVGDYALFMGRLSKEKGLSTLISAWNELENIPLMIVGDGPMYPEIQKQAIDNNQIKLIGQIPHANALETIKNARMLVFPSEWYETFGRGIIEAYACGKPVIASNLGAMTELVHDGETGLLFNPGDPLDLAQKVRTLWNSPEKLLQMSQNARTEYEAKYTPEKNYQQLMAIYQMVIERNVTRKLNHA